ncbi:hypothetical protein Tco_0167191 [Tanacetum coccineum]
MASNIKNFKCLIHFNETQRGSILSEDLTYSMLHEMVMQKFNLEANAVINLSFKLSSFDFAVDITDAEGKVFDNKESLILAVRLKALSEGFQFLTDRSALERYSYVPQLSTPGAYDRCCAFKGSIQGNKSGSCGHGWKQLDCAAIAEFAYMAKGETCSCWSWDVRTQSA